MQLYQNGHKANLLKNILTTAYRLPEGVDAENLQSLLSTDGILTVEAPLPSIPLPADVIIPIQVLIGSDSNLIFNHTVWTYSLLKVKIRHLLFWVAHIALVYK